MSDKSYINFSPYGTTLFTGLGTGTSWRLVCTLLRLYRHIYILLGSRGVLVDGSTSDGCRCGSCLSHLGVEVSLDKTLNRAFLVVMGLR